MPSSHVLPPVTRILVSLVLFAAMLTGQPAAPAKKPGKVDGMVINSVTGDPVKKATVILNAMGQPESLSAATDSTGHFHFDNVTPGQYLPFADRAGYVQTGPVPGTPFISKPFAVAEEQAVKDVVVKLLPLAVVNGHVFDDDGDPIARAQVQALRYVYRQGGARRLTPAGFGSTDDLGEFQLLDLEPGRYYFRATVETRNARVPPRTRRATAEEAYPDTFYPSATGAAQATASQLAPGAQLNNIDFRMRKTNAHHVRGKVVDGRTGQPVHNTSVSLESHGAGFSMGRSFAQVQQDGTFDLRGVVSGAYRAIAQPAGGLSCVEAVNVGDQDVDDVQLVCMPPFEVSGTLRVDGPPPQNSGAAQVSLIAKETGAGSGPPGVVDKDGNFAIRANPDVYRVQVMGAAGVYVKSVHFGDQDVSKGDIDLTQQSSGALNIVMGTDVAQMQGLVQNERGEPAPGSVITICPENEDDDRLDLHIQLMTDENGKFDYRDFAPGDYKVFAWEGGDQEMLQSPEFRKAFESRAASVSLSSGGHASIQLTLIPSADIEAEKNKLP
jgi:protocatechuate 3,4-dioxygenase beta subunit